MVETRNHAPVSGMGFTQSGLLQTARSVYDYNMPAQTTTDSAGYQTGYNVSGSKAAFNMEMPVARAQADAQGYSSTGPLARGPTAISQTDMMPLASSDAAGYTNTGVAPNQQPRTNVSLGPGASVDAGGMTNTSTF